MERLPGVRVSPRAVQSIEEKMLDGASPSTSLPQNETQEVVLSSDEALALDLAITKKRAAVAEERLAALELKSAQANLMGATKNEVVVLSRIAAAHEIKNLRAAKLSGNKLLYQSE